MEELIKLIKSQCKGVLPENSGFDKKPGNNGARFVLSSNDCKDAYLQDNETPVKTCPWCGNYWLYLDIRFDKVEIPKKPKSKMVSNLLDSDRYNEELKKCLFLDKNYYRVFVFLTVFYEDSDANRKIQLFRAEWDNYADNDIHPQPHWHFHHQRESGFESEDFDQVSEGVRVFSIERMHFAMNGQWADREGNHIHPINDENALARWLAGLLSHIQGQLMSQRKKEKDEHHSF